MSNFSYLTADQRPSWKPAGNHARRPPGRPPPRTAGLHNRFPINFRFMEKVQNYILNTGNVNVSYLRGQKICKCYSPPQRDQPLLNIVNFWHDITLLSSINQDLDICRNDEHL